MFLLWFASRPRRTAPFFKVCTHVELNFSWILYKSTFVFHFYFRPPCNVLPFVMLSFTQSVSHQPSPTFAAWPIVVRTIFLSAHPHGLVSRGRSRYACPYYAIRTLTWTYSRFTICRQSPLIFFLPLPSTTSPRSRPPVATNYTLTFIFKLQRDIDHRNAHSSKLHKPSATRTL